MKSNFLIFILLISVCMTTYSQENQSSPTLNLTGSSPSLSKGNINTEVLTAIIQQKQEEIKQRVFRNTIVNQFKNPDNKYTKKLNNFSTFNYLYNLMDILTSGKNKKVMTNSAVESSAEFAFIFGLALYHNEQTVNDAKVQELSGKNSKKVKVGANANDVKEFNILIDLCYDIVIKNEDRFQNLFKFKESINNLTFQRWYNSDNKFILEMNKARDVNNPDIIRQNQLNDLKDSVEYSVEKLLSISELSDDLINKFGPITNENLRIKINSLKEKLKEMDGSELKSEIGNIQTTFKDYLTQGQISLLNKFSDKIDSDYYKYKDLYNFYRGLKKSNFKDFTLNKDQYYALKYIILKFIDVAKNQYPNDAIATVLDFLMENTIVEFNDNSGNLVNENSKGSKTGYLYIDVESVIYTIDQRFSSTTKKGFKNYITPFFSIGTNYASFTETNSLTTDNNGNQISMGNLYFASEKIGVKWKLWNWKYTHAFEAGENFDYYWIKQTHWKRPQEQPLISDVHILAYGSGLLYNLVDLKSEDNFDYAVFGAGIGITFFNGLSANITVASPMIDKNLSSKNAFVNFGLDIPIVEYISALTK